MNRKLKTSVISLFFLFAIASAIAVPQPPHEAYGTITDNGEQAEGITVEAVTGSDTFSDTTDSNGYYEIKVPSNYSSFDLVVDGTTQESGISVSSGAIEEYSFSGNYIEDSSSNNEETNNNNQSNEETTTPPTNTQPEPKQVDAEVDPETGQASAQVDRVEENQQVQVNIPDTEQAESTVEQVGFTSSSSSDSVSVSVSDLGSDRPEDVSEDAGTDVYSYQQIDVEGVEDEDITESNVNFKVRKSFLDERDRSPEDVVMKRYKDNNWQELDTRISEELDNSYRFKASSTGFSYYSIALREQDSQTQGEPNIQASSLSVQPSEGTPPFDVTIDVTVDNTGDAAGSQEVEVMLGDQVIKSETVSLEAGESRTLSYNYTVEQSGSQLSFSSGNQSTTVEASQKGTSMLPVAVALLIVAILGVVGYTQREAIQDRIEDFRE